MISIREIDPTDSAALRTWYDAMRAGATAGRVAPMLSAYDEMRISLQDPSPDFERRVFAAYDAAVDPEAVLGTVLIELSRRENPQLAEIEVNVPPTYRNRGVGAALFEHARTEAVDRGRTSYLCEVNIPSGHTTESWPGARFADAHGFASRHIEDHLVLEVPDGAALDELAMRVGIRRDGYAFRTWTGATPDEHVDQQAVLRTAMERDVPIGDLEFEPWTWDADRLRLNDQRHVDQGYTAVTTVAVAPDGSYAGYSMLLVPAYNEPEVWQEDTLVLSAHRGHRLGSALKLCNLRELTVRFPDRRRVHTWTAQSNGPMQTINRAFGFEVVEVMHEFQRVDAQ